MCPPLATVKKLMEVLILDVTLVLHSLREHQLEPLQLEVTLGATLWLFVQLFGGSDR